MIKKISTIIVMLALIMNLGVVAYAQESDLSQEDNNVEYVFSVEDLKDGVTIVMLKNNNGENVSYVCEDPSQVPMAYDYDDGSIEVAIFHVGFKNWNDNKGSLYFAFECDEATDSLQGDFYVKTTGLFPDTYWSGSNSYNMFGCYATTRYIKQGIDVGDATAVKVGFSNVTFTSIYGETGWFSNTSQIVYK